MKKTLLIGIAMSMVAAAPAAKKLKVTSPAFKEGGTIPDANVYSGFGCTGGNTSPALEWTGAPDGTKSFAVVVYDPDAPTGVGFFHWSLVDIPAATTKLDAGAGDPAKDNAKRPAGATLGYTDFGKTGYNGPCPPPGKPHRYEFTVYALDTDKLGVDGTATGAMVRFMLKQHTLAEGTLTGKFGR